LSGGVYCLVFTKDREMQLDAFLRSAERYASYAAVSICGTTGKPFEEDVRYFLRTAERVVFHTDDDVFFRRTWLPPDRWQAVHSYSLGANTTYCHPLDCAQTVPEPLDTQLLWKWREAQGDFGYPLCLNATIYRSADLLPLLQGWHFANPTELEAGLAYRAELFQPEWMTAPLHSCCVSLPHNRVSSSSGCRTGSNPDWQPDRLCEMFLDGWRIDLDRMDFTHIVGAHQEVPLAFTRRQG